MKEDLYAGFIQGVSSESYNECKQPSTTLDNLSTMSVLYNESTILGKLSENIIMVDCDTKEDSEALLKIMQAVKLTVPYMKTQHGYHFYFLKSPHCTSSYIGALTACGIVVDYKLGWRNGLDVVKIQGQWRETFNDNAELIPLPKFLKPVKTTGDGRLSFAKLEEGFRNDTLFKFVGTLKRAGFNQKETNQLLHVINNYVMPKPLAMRDIDSISRQQAYDNAFTEKERFDPDVVAEDLISKYKFAVNADMLYQRIDGVYRPLSPVEIDRLIVDNCEHTNIRMRKEVLALVKVKANDLDLTYDTLKDPQLVPFENGVLDMDNNTIISYDDCHTCFLAKVPHIYSMEEKSCPIAEQFINDITQGDASLAELLYQIIGACLYRRSELRGFFILIGPKGNGKSTFLKWLNYILGNANVSHILLNQLNDRFFTKNLMGKMANLAEDISDTYISDATIIKSITTSDTIQADIKYHEPVVFAPFCTMVFTANFLPNISDPTGAVQSRIVPVPFTADFLKAPNRRILDQLCTEEAAQWALRQGVAAFNRARAAGTYTKPKSVQETSDDFEQANNPILQFLYELEDLERELVEADITTIYSSFQSFCNNENIPCMGRTKFTRRVKAVVKNIDRKRYRNQVTNKLSYKFVKIDTNQPITL